MEGIYYFIIATFIILSFGASAYKLPSQNLKFTLGNNIIINSNISSPKISPQYFKLFNGEANNWTTKGKYIQYIDICLLRQNFQVCPVFHGATCGWQFLDSDSDFTNQLYYQSFSSQGIQEYQLRFDWISEISYLLASTGLSVYWNGEVVDTFYDSNCTLYTSTYYVKGKVGLNELAFEGKGVIDNQGILLRNIQVQVVSYIYPNANNSNKQTNSTSNISKNSNSSSSNLTNSSNQTLNSTQDSTNSPPQNSTNGNSSNNSSSDDSNTTYNYTAYDNLYQFYNSSSYKSLLRLYQFSTKYQFVNFCHSLFGSQQNIRFLVGFMMEFNHLIPYNYHIRNLTLMSNLIFVSVQAFDDQKGYLTDQYIYPKMGISAITILQEFSNRRDLNTNINNIVTQFIKRPNGILLQITDFFIVDVPVTIIMFLIGYALFHLLFHYKISTLFRQYSLFGLFFYLLLNGKIQILTFHYLSELMHFFSDSFGQKILMVIIVFFYFFIFTLSIGSMMLYKSSYKNLVKFIYENCRYPQCSMLFMTVSFGIYNLALGFTHRLLINYPNQQICLLLFIQVVYLIVLAILMARSFFQNLIMALILCIINVLRIIFIVTCLIYSLNTQLQNQISYVQEYVFYALIVSFLLSIIIGILDRVIFIFKIVIRFLNNKKNKPNTVVPNYLSNKAHKPISQEQPMKQAIKTIKQKSHHHQKPSNYILTIESSRFRRFKKTTLTRVDRLQAVRMPQNKVVNRLKSFAIKKDTENTSRIPT